MANPYMHTEIQFWPSVEYCPPMADRADVLINPLIDRVRSGIIPDWPYTLKTVSGRYSPQDRISPPIGDSQGGGFGPPVSFT